MQLASFHHVHEHVCRGREREREREGDREIQREWEMLECVRTMQNTRWNTRMAHARSLTLSLTQDPDGSLLQETGFSGEDHLQDFSASSDAMRCQSRLRKQGLPSSPKSESPGALRVS